MRRHILSRPTWRPVSVAERNGFSALRHASIRTLSELTIFGSSVHYEIRLFELKALQSSERSSWRVDQVHIAQSPLDPKRSSKSRGLRHFTLGSLLCQDLHLLSLSRQISAPMRVVERLVDLSGHPQVLQKSTESFLATATAARFLAFLPPREAIFSP